MYDKLQYFKDNYARPGMPDQRAVQDFVECENREVVRGFQVVLNAVMAGNFRSESLDAILGKERAVRHGSYQDWARLMLMWMNESMRR